MALSPHHHTGRRTSHRQTSYGALVFVVLLVGVMLAGVTGKTWADDVTVSAAVVGPKPTSAPVITVPITGQHFSSSPIAIKGTCTPGLLVNVYKNDVLAGAALCDANGKFAITADIFIGRNDLVARMYDQANQPSPDSNVVTVFYDVAAIPSLADGSQNIGTHGNFIITSDSVYKGTVPGKSLSWQIHIEGGVAPFAFNIEWGDGQTELLSRSASGDFTIQHTYDHAGGYKGGYVVTVNGVDAEGTKAILQVVAIVNNPVGTLAPTQVTPPSSWWRLLVAWPLWLVLVLMLISFWLGERRQRTVDNRSPRTPAPVPIGVG